MVLTVIERLFDLINRSRPILMVLLFAALIVFLNSYPSVPDIAEETNDYRQQMKNKANLDFIDSDIDIAPPSSPSLPHAIAPVVTPEVVDELVNPPTVPEPKPINDQNDTVIDTSPATEEPSLEIKLLTGFLNVAPLILIATLGGFGIYLLFKHKKHLTLRTVFGSAIALVGVCVLLFIGYIVYGFVVFLYDIEIEYNILTWFTIPMALPLGALLSYSIIAKNTTVFRRNMGLVVAGSLMGAFLAAFLPYWMIFILLIAITLFDIYSVKFGPIKKIMDLEKVQHGKKSKTKKNEKSNKKGDIKEKEHGFNNGRVNEIDIGIEKRKNVELIEKKPIENLEIKKKEQMIVENNEKTNQKTKLVEKKVVYGTLENSNKVKSKSSQKIDKNNNLVSCDNLEIGEMPNNKPNSPELKIKYSTSKSIRKKRRGITAGKDEFDLVLMYDNPDWSLGLGDFVIYSMFTSAVLTYSMLYLPYYIFYTPILGIILPWLIFFLCSIGIILGFFKTIKLLEKREYLPGLPISVAYGFSIFIICILILQIINFILYNEFAIIF